MTETDQTDLALVADDDLLARHVIDDDHELHYLDCYLSEILQKPEV